MLKPGMNLDIMISLIFTVLFIIKTVVGAPTQINDIAEIEIIGNKFFESTTGNQFFMKGIAYQPSRSMKELEAAEGTYETKYIDPLADPEICLRDIPFLQELGVNTIRVYSIDPTKSHDECMDALSEAGIYVLLDLAEPDVSIPRDRPVWDVNIWKRYKDVVDAMHKYPNILGFFAGNEVTNDKTNTHASPFVKAAIRDVKEYIKSQKYRKIPVGYSSNDDADTRENLAQYFACDDDHADFYGVNMYEWCGYSSYGTSGYKERTEEFEDYPLPIFFSEFGCNLVRPRPFTEVGALFGPKMSKIWSGGLAYMYFEEENEYGVVKVNDNGDVEKLDDFEYLRNEYMKAKPQGIQKKEYASSERNKNVKCPSIGASKDWKASNKVPPKPDVEKCDCLGKYLPCLVVPYDDSTKYQEIFDTVCSKVNCSDIMTDGSSGIYGQFADCSTEQKLALQISKLYAINNAAHSANDNGGSICPFAGKNVYFNNQYKRLSNDAKCSKFGFDFMNFQSNTSPSGTTVENEDNKVTTEVPTTKAGSGSVTQYKNSGYAILFVTVFIASLLL
ncbi:hypothetical protein HG537_0F03360 [Torulaspora globosa]|uniref:1,3-beta-glucanosyltransferase n=1 Tax=Torulaspora globosa TaxID=48254 RepID=A0A7H9HYD9_9SACH|nr:hypothetical protein HG537_0F03360 [Torulaspora sp. CBS 2947]